MIDLFLLISAASFIGTLAAIALAGVVMTLLIAPRKPKARSTPDSWWRAWEKK